MGVVTRFGSRGPWGASELRRLIRPVAGRCGPKFFEYRDASGSLCEKTSSLHSIRTERRSPWGDTGAARRAGFAAATLAAASLTVSQAARCDAIPDAGGATPELTRANDNFFAEWNEEGDLQIFAGTSNPDLAREVCSHLGLSLGRVKLGRHTDGEVTLEILDEVRGRDVFIIQSAPCASSSSDPHSSIMELLLFVAAAKRSSAKRVTAVLPYASYFRQSQILAQAEMNQPLAAADFSRLLASMGVDRVVFMDVHCQGSEGFFPEVMPVTNILPDSLAIEYFRRKRELFAKDVVVVATHNTGVDKAQAFMSRLTKAGFNCTMAALVSNRPFRPQREESGSIQMLQSEGGWQTVSGGKLISGKQPQPRWSAEDNSNGVWAETVPPQDPRGTGTADFLVGDVEGRNCIIVDDIIDTGERAVNTAVALKAAGARRVYMYATHGLFSRGAVDRLVKSPLKEVVITDTVKLPGHLYCEKLRVISVSKLLAEAIRRISLKLPLSELHRDAEYDSIRTVRNYQQ